MRRSSLAALLLLAAGVGVVALLVWSIGWSALYETIAPVGRNIPLLMVPYALVYVFDGMGWYHAFGARKPPIALHRLFTLRMAGESLNNITPLGYVGGEPAKALLLQRAGVPFADALASVVIGKTVMTLAQIPFVMLGVAAAATELEHAGPFGRGLVALTLLLSVGTLASIALQKRGLLTGLIAIADALRLGRRIPESARASLRETDQRLGAFYRERRRDFALSFGCFFLGWLAGVPEVLIALSSMGQEVGLGRALAIESLAAVIKIAGFFVPASMGAQEAGTTALLTSFGYSPEVALSFSLLRRAREIVWIAVGLACLAHHGGRPAPSPRLPTT